MAVAVGAGTVLSVYVSACSLAGSVYGVVNGGRSCSIVVGGPWIGKGAAAWYAWLVKDRRCPTVSTSHACRKSNPKRHEERAVVIEGAVGVASRSVVAWRRTDSVLLKRLCAHVYGDSLRVRKHVRYSRRF